MRAVEISTPGGPEVLRVVERPKPEPKAGEVLIEVRAAGVSHADVMQRKGSYPPPPGVTDIPGLECAGVLAVTGEPVCALLAGGGYQEYVAVPREQVLPVPDGWSFVEAATLPENVFTVYDNLVTRAHFARGESILIHGGTSGIGSTAIMLAKAFGASFIAGTAGSDQKCAAMLSFGADVAMNYKEQDFVEQIMHATSGRGVDVIIDIVGGDYIERGLKALAFDGRIVVISAPRGTHVHVDLAFMMKKRTSISSSSLRARTPEQKGAIAKELLQHVWPLLPAKDPIRPLVDSVFSFDEARLAHERLEASAHIGKIVLVPLT